MTELITYCIIAVCGLLLALLIAYPLKFLWKPVLRCIISTGALILANLIGIPFNFSVGINIINVAVCAVLGVPGFTMLILFSLLL